MPENAAEKLPIQWLEALLRFAESPSMEVAARQLGVTQPALSKQLKGLESRMALPIFAQEGKRKVLTAYGREVVAEIRPRFAGLEQNMRQLSLRHADAGHFEIRICARREVLDRLAPRLKFAGKLQLIEAGHEEILQRLTARECELGLTYEAPDSLEFHARPLFRESFQFLVPKTFARTLTADNITAALTHRPTVAYRIHDELLTAAAASVGLESPTQILRITDNYDSLVRMIEAGLGWGVVPSHYAASSCWSLPVPPRAIQGREFRLIYRKELAKARWMKDLLTEVGRTFTPKEHD